MNINATIIGQMIAFGIFVWFCMKYVWPPIMKAIEERQRSIAEALASAEKAKQDQTKTKLIVDQELMQAKLKAQEIIDMANKRRDEILNEVKNEAEVLKANIINQGYAEVENERKRIKDELRMQLASLAVAGAEKIVRHNIDEAANNEIIENFIAEL